MSQWHFEKKAAADFRRDRTIRRDFGTETAYLTYLRSVAVGGRRTGPHGVVRMVSETVPVTNSALADSAKIGRLSAGAFAHGLLVEFNQNPVVRARFETPLGYQAALVAWAKDARV